MTAARANHVLIIALLDAGADTGVKELYVSSGAG